MSCVLLCSLTLSYSLEGKSLTEPRTRSTVSNCQQLSNLVSALQYCNSTWVTGLYRPALLAFFFPLVVSGAGNMNSDPHAQSHSKLSYLLSHCPSPH